MKENSSNPSDLTSPQAGIEDDFVTGLQAWVDEATAPEGEREKRAEAMRRMIDARSNGRISLSLSGLGLSSLPAQIGEFTALIILDLGHNQLTTLPESIGDLKALTILDLVKNPLTELPERIGDLTALTRLDLRYNQLTTIPEQIGNLTALIILDLGHNQLTTLPEQIGNLTALTILDLVKNPLTELPERIGDLTALTRLDLRYNQLTKLPESIGGLNALMGLNLFGSRLTKLPESIGGLKALTSLDLFDNQLTELPESIGNLKALTNLDLRYNQLNSSPTLLDRLSELEIRGCQIYYPHEITLELRVDRAESRLNQVARTLFLANSDPKSNLNKLTHEIIGEVIKFTDAHQLSEEKKKEILEAAEEDVKQKMHERHVEANLTTDNKKSETEVVENVEEEYKSDSDELPSEKDIESEEKYKSKSSKDRGAAAEEDEKTAAAITEASASREGADGQRVDTTAGRTLMGRVCDSFSSILPKNSIFTTTNSAQSLKNKESNKSDPSRK